MEFLMAGRLYEINMALRSLLEGTADIVVDENTGEFFDKDSIDKLNLAREEKLEGCAVVYKEREAQIKALADEIKTLTERKQALQRRQDSFKRYIQENMSVGEKLETSRCKISFRKSESAEVAVDPSELPACYQKVTYAADKAAIKEALKNGEVVDGCRLVVNQNVQIK